jgi:hypothetical protein
VVVQPKGWDRVSIKGNLYLNQWEPSQREGIGLQFGINRKGDEERRQ